MGGVRLAGRIHAVTRGAASRHRRRRLQRVRVRPTRRPLGRRPRRPTGLALRVVHAWVWPMFTKDLGPVKGVAGSGLRHSAETILAEGVGLARGVAWNYPSPQPPGTRVRPGRPGSPSTVSWRPDCPHRSCARPPRTPPSLWWVAGVWAACSATSPARSAWSWPAPPVPADGGPPPAPARQARRRRRRCRGPQLGDAGRRRPPGRSPRRRVAADPCGSGPWRRPGGPRPARPAPRRGTAGVLHRRGPGARPRAGSLRHAEGGPGGRPGTRGGRRRRGCAGARDPQPAGGLGNTVSAVLHKAACNVLVSR